jgi:hypothetical protein
LTTLIGFRRPTKTQHLAVIHRQRTLPNFVKITEIAPIIRLQVSKHAMEEGFKSHRYRHSQPPYFPVIMRKSGGFAVSFGGCWQRFGNTRRFLGLIQGCGNGVEIIVKQVCVRVERQS